MEQLYWFCFVAGAVTAVLLVLFDNIVGGWLDGVLDFLPDFINPISLMTGIVAFGGAGILLMTYSSLTPGPILIISILAALVISISLFFFYVKPMRQAENSIAYSVTELPGKIGEVTIPIPVGGFGEAAFAFGPTIVHEIADSTEKDELRAGEKVLAIMVKDRVVTVCRWIET
jgi:hypothetical protein